MATLRTTAHQLARLNLRSADAGICWTRSAGIRGAQPGPATVLHPA